MKITVRSFLLKIAGKPNKNLTQGVWINCMQAFITCMFLVLFLNSNAQNLLLDKPITIKRTQTTLYEALKTISDQADCLFMYDSKWVDSEKKVRIAANNQKLSEVLDILLNDKNLSYKVIGKHILIFRSEQPTELNSAINKVLIKDKVAPSYSELRGRVMDAQNKQPLAYATIGIPGRRIGTVSNSDGYFILKLPDSLNITSLQFSYMGYESKDFPVELFEKQQINIFLAPKIISMQEVIIRYVDPNVILEKAMINRTKNYSLDPVYLNSFYREGVKKNKRLVSYSEGVFKIFKPSSFQEDGMDQVKILKSRRVVNSNPSDTVYVKLKAGIQSALLLDIIKSMPDFLDEEQQDKYDFFYTDILHYDNREAYAVFFRQKPTIKEPLYTGTLYIDIENYAILGATFEINPSFVDKAANQLIVKKSKNLTVNLQQIKYSVSYTGINEKYYINHALCEMSLKTRQKSKLTSDNFVTFLEMATFSVDTLAVQKFQRHDILKPEVIFSEISNEYDELFWGDYNYLVPEEKLSDALSRIIGKMEHTEMFE